ncbi:MAG TPA: peptide ABC transporter permease, partial [bacterium]|nr:peptide ABC transporter permease [bacterium]
MIEGTRTTAALAAPRRRDVRHLRVSLGAGIGFAMLAVIVFAAVFAPQITRYDPVKTDLLASLQPPSAAHPL